jgi:dihydrofolate synthase/folylpolyglutamate synthase
MSFSDLYSAFHYIESFTNFEKETPQSVREYKLDRMQLLLELFGNPHHQFETVHLAGSKGKGSTGAFLASILREAGFRTGLYTSPHVSSYKERITLATHQLEDSLFIRLINSIKNTLEKRDIQPLFAEEGPTTFELLTLLAFIAFREIGCTWVVVETGIGGRLDATNIVTPQACVLTPVELEHTDILGDTIEKIAFEKAGIIKPGTPAFSSSQYPEVKQLFEKTAHERSAPLFFLEDSLSSFRIKQQREGMEVYYSWHRDDELRARLKLLGDFQAENSALAVLTARFLLGNKLSSSPASRIDTTIVQGLENTRLSGRMELCSEEPPIILDGAHTPVSVTRLMQAVQTLYPGDKILFFGSITGKDSRKMASILAPQFKTVIISTPGWFKKSNPREVYAFFRDLHNDVRLCPDPGEAYRTALSLAGRTTPIIVTGSFYMIAEIRRLIHGFKTVS